MALRPPASSRGCHVIVGTVGFCPPRVARHYGLAIAEFPGSFTGHDGQLPGFNSFTGYAPEKGATVVVFTNLYSAPDGSQPANEITRLIIRELSSTDGEGTEESTAG